MLSYLLWLCVIVISTDETYLLLSRQWREEHAERLAKKDAEETQSLEDLQTQAKTELEEWYNRHEEQLNQTKGLNRWVEPRV